MMRRMATTALLAFGFVAGWGSTARAESCTPFLDQVFEDHHGPYYYYWASGVRVAVRAHSFTSLALHPDYRASDGISTPAQEGLREFPLDLVASGDIEGPFRQVFTDRKDGVTDPGVLRLRADRSVYVAGGLLSMLQCYRNPSDPDNSFMLTGHRTAGSERSIWTFYLWRTQIG